MRLWISRRVGPFRVGATFSPRSRMRYQQGYQPGAPSGDFVYVIQSPHAVKVGVTRDLQGRLATLQTGSPHQLTLAYHLPISGDAYAVEAEAHGILGRYRMEGEWFATAPDVAVAAINAAAYRLGVRQDNNEAHVPSWTKRILGIAALYTPQWVALTADSPLTFLILFCLASAAFAYSMVRLQALGPVGFSGFLKWCGALVAGLALSIIAGLAIGSLVKPAFACSGCGCAGGPGYRLPTGRCASWAQFRSDCNGTCFPPGTHDERGGLALRVPPPSPITSIGQTPSPQGSVVTPK